MVVAGWPYLYMGRGDGVGPDFFPVSSVIHLESEK